MKKMIILSIFMIFLSGCEAIYTVKIENQTLYDNTKIFDKSNVYHQALESEEKKEEIVDTLYKFEKENAFGFERNFFEENGNSGFEYISSFPIKKGYDNWPTLAGQCFPYYDFYVQDNFLKLKTAPNFTCFQKFTELKKATIQIKTDYKVIRHNADKVDKNTYIWYFNREDTLNQILYKQIIMDMEYLNEKTQKNTHFIPVILVLLSILTIGIITYFLIQKWKQKETF